MLTENIPGPCKYIPYIWYSCSDRHCGWWRVNGLSGISLSNNSKQRHSGPTQRQFSGGLFNLGPAAPDNDRRPGRPGGRLLIHHRRHPKPRLRRRRPRTPPRRSSRCRRTRWPITDDRPKQKPLQSAEYAIRKPACERSPPRRRPRWRRPLRRTAGVRRRPVSLPSSRR